MIKKSKVLTLLLTTYSLLNAEEQLPVKPESVTALDTIQPSVNDRRYLIRDPLDEPRRPKPKKETMANLSQEQKEKLKNRPALAKDRTRQNKNVLNTVYLGQYLDPWKGMDENETFQLNFENRDLRDFLRFLENALKVTFILPDNLEPAPTDQEAVSRTKITFESKFPFNRKQLWELGLTFLEMTGFALIPTSESRTYRVIASASKDKASANREPLPTFIGIDPEYLPNNDSKIRYVYFVENADLATIKNVIETMKSSTAGPLIEFPTLRAIIITDRAANIKSLMQILQELDKVTMPEELAIIKLQRTDARRVAELYNELIGKTANAPQQPFNPFMGNPRKPPTTQYFTPSTRLFAEPRTNSLIVLGTRENVQKVEDFIVREIDKEILLPFSPLHIVQLRYIQADSVAEILNKIIQDFNRASPDNINASLYGGVRDGNKFFRPTVKITAEPSGNRLIINSDYEEYLKLREIIDKLDVEQPQVAIKVLILNVDLTNNKQLGTQLRNKVDCCDGTGGAESVLGKNINFQTSGVATGPIVPRDTVPGRPTDIVTGAERLLGNLIQLASAQPIGTTLVTLGQDIFGVWGLVKALETFTRVSVVANPFLITTHKYRAEVSVGQTRRVLGSQVISGGASGDGFVDIPANLTVSITPQISYDDMVTLSIYVSLEQFTSPIGADRTIKRISTEALLANKEVLALGGLIRDDVTEQENKVPILGDIPLLGWLFKSKIKSVDRSSLVILVSPEIIRPYEPEAARAYTQLKINDAKDTLYAMQVPAEKRDPLHRFIFRDHKQKENAQIDKFISMQERYVDESQRKMVEPPLVQKNPRKKSLLDLVKPDEDIHKEEVRP